jgi:hypothetical protein
VIWNDFSDSKDLVQQPGLPDSRMATAGVKEVILVRADQVEEGVLVLKEAAALDTVPIPVILSKKTNVTHARNIVTGPKVQMKNLEGAGTTGSYNPPMIIPRNSDAFEF